MGETIQRRTRWIFRWPDARGYLEGAPGFVRAFGGGTFSEGRAYYIEDYGGAALWLPPDVHPDEEGLGEVIESTVEESTRGDLYSVLGKLKE